MKPGFTRVRLFREPDRIWSRWTIEVDCDEWALEYASGIFEGRHVDFKSLDAHMRDKTSGYALREDPDGNLELIAIAEGRAPLREWTAGVVNAKRRSSVPSEPE